MIKDTIQGMIDKFHERMAEDEKARAEVEPIYKTVNLNLDTEVYSLILDHGEIKDFKEELLPEADITVTSTPEYLQAMIDGELRMMKAYLTGKVKVKGKFDDLKHLKKLF